MNRRVVFVCEHGAAKSLVAAAWLVRLAREVDLPVSAIGRGTQPDLVLSPEAVAGLDSDGIPINCGVPRLVRPRDLHRAWRVISFGPDLSPLMPPGSGFETWSVPAISDGYEEARNRIIERLHVLLTTADFEVRPPRRR